MGQGMLSQAWETKKGESLAGLEPGPCGCAGGEKVSPRPLRTYQLGGSLCSSWALSQGATTPPSLWPHCPRPAKAGSPKRGPASLTAHRLPTSSTGMVAGPACSPGSPPPGLMALMEGGRPPSCQSGGAPRSPSWLEQGGWAGAGAGLSGPSQRRGRRGAA